MISSIKRHLKKGSVDEDNKSITSDDANKNEIDNLIEGEDDGD